MKSADEKGSQPSVSVYFDHSKGAWRANVYFKDTKRRYRPYLPVAASDDPGQAFEDFKALTLPGLIAKHAAEIAVAARLAVEVETMARDRKTAGGPTLRELADWFIDTHLPYEDRADKTIDHYRRHLDRFIGYCSSRHIARAQQLSGRIVQEWQMQSAADRGREGPSRDEVMAVRHWLDTCATMGELRELPDIKWAVPSKTKSKRFKAYPRDLVERWVVALRKHRPKAAAVAEWVTATGWRIGDALDLRVGEIDLKRNAIDRAQLKTSDDLPYPLTPALRKMALTALQGREKPADDEYVFLDHRARPWDYQQLVKLIDYFHKSKRWDGPAITFRDLRKSFGTSLAMDGCPPNVLKELMGHSSIEMTLSYYVAVDLPKMAEWSNRHAPLKDHPKAPPPVSPAEDSQ